MRYFLLVFFFAIFACNGSQENTSSDSSGNDTLAKQDSLPDSVAKPVNTVLDSVKDEENDGLIRWTDQEIYDLLDAEIPAGYELLDSMYGDLNNDEYLDLLVVLRNQSEDSLQDLARPLLIFIGQEDQGPLLVRTNNNVVLCKGCGGVFGDPYDGLAIKNGYFSVENYGGSSWRWFRVITFKYDETKQDWILYRDASVDYSVWEPERETETTINEDDFGKVKFEDYNNSK